MCLCINGEDFKLKVGSEKNGVAIFFMNRIRQQNSIMQNFTQHEGKRANFWPRQHSQKELSTPIHFEIRAERSSKEPSHQEAENDS
jgi:hypothetical protein